MNKYITCLLIAFCVALPMAGQQEYQGLYEKKINSYTHMRSMGWTMAGIGSGCVIAGTALLISVPDSYWHNSDYNDDDMYDEVDYTFKVISGIIFTGVGIGLSAGGLTMAGISMHKIHAYRGKLNNLTLGLVCTPNKTGLTLTYRF